MSHQASSEGASTGWHTFDRDKQHQSFLRSVRHASTGLQATHSQTGPINVSNPSALSRYDRICEFCHKMYGLRHVDDEFHALMNCPIGTHARTSLVQSVSLDSLSLVSYQPHNRLSQLFIALATPQNPQHAATLARLLRRTQALRPLLIHWLDANGTLPDPSTT
jgi:hypothetical protein